MKKFQRKWTQELLTITEFQYAMDFVKDAIKLNVEKEVKIYLQDKVD